LYEDRNANQQASTRCGIPAIFVEDMSFCSVSERFIENCVESIQHATDYITVLRDGDSVLVSAMEKSDGKLRLIIRNNRHHYVTPRIDVKRTIDSIQAQTKFPFGPIAHNGSILEVKVPNKGIAILDVTLASESVSHQSDSQEKKSVC